MRDNSTVIGQLYEACDRNRTAARLLDYFLGLHTWKTKRKPSESPDSPELYLDFTVAQLAERLLVNEKTIRRALEYLAGRRFITKHRAPGFNRSHRYELHRALVETCFQELPLITAIEQNQAGPEVDTMSASIRSKCPHRCGHYVRIIYPSSSLLFPSFILIVR